MNRLIILIITCFLHLIVFAEWKPVQTGINDDFSGITFNNSVGFITGKKGTYFSIDGGKTINSWIQTNKFDSIDDSIIYKNSQFKGCCSDIKSKKIYFCGQDTVQKKGVIFSFDLVTFSIKQLFITKNNSNFNKIAINIGTGQVFCVGDEGLIVTFNQSTPNNVETIVTSFKDNLQSISIQNEDIIISSPNSRFIGKVFYNKKNVINFTYINKQTNLISDYTFIGNNEAIGIGENYYKLKFGWMYSEAKDYYASKLNGTTLYYTQNKLFVGTSNGVYIKMDNSDVLELFPDTKNYYIKSFYQSDSTLYSCGNNGLLLYTDDLGGDSQAYASIKTNGGCVNTFTNIASIKGSVVSCKWYIDNKFENNSCSDFNKKYTSEGEHKLKLVFQDSKNNLDSLETTFSITSFPNVKKIIIEDSILCINDSLKLKILNSDQNVYYQLYNYKNSTIYGQTEIGNGEEKTLKSTPILQNDLFYLKATNNLTGCTTRFKDTIHVKIENPKANFRNSIINAEIGEEITFYSICPETVTYKWEFPSTASSSNSNVKNPKISFNSNLNNSIKLVAISSKGCMDSIIKNGPFIYNKKDVKEGCYGMVAKDNEGQWQGFEQANISNLTKSKSGFYIGGVIDSLTLPSRLGDSVKFNFKGSYVAKYSNEGVLKWYVNTNLKLNDNNYHPLQPNQILEDKNKNCYIIGRNSPYLDCFIDNTGDSTELFENYILKLDENGKLLWYKNINTELLN